MCFHGRRHTGEMKSGFVLNRPTLQHAVYYCCTRSRRVGEEDCVCLFLRPQALSNIDELFDREELSAAPDPGWPDCFNSGVFVFCPSMETYGKLLQYCTEHGSFDGKPGGTNFSHFCFSQCKDDSLNELLFKQNVQSYFPSCSGLRSSDSVLRLSVCRCVHVDLFLQYSVWSAEEYNHKLLTLVSFYKFASKDTCHVITECITRKNLICQESVVYRSAEVWCHWSFFSRTQTFWLWTVWTNAWLPVTWC